MSETIEQQQHAAILKFVGTVWREIYDNWMKTNQLELTVIPSQDVRGMSYEQLRQLTFHVGANRLKLVPMSATTLAIFFALFKSQVAAVNEMKRKGVKGKAAFKTAVNVAPSDDEVRTILTQIPFTIDRPGAPSTPTPPVA